MRADPWMWTVRCRARTVRCTRAPTPAGFFASTVRTALNPLHLPDLRIMAAIRHHLRALVLIWLTCQAAVLSAFVPTGCCPEPAATAAATEECHGADGLCPMHQAQHDAAQDTSTQQIDCPMHATQTTPVPCVMRGLCSGPSAAISMLFPAFALPELPFTLDQSLQTASHASAPPQVIAAPSQIDTPPPRP